MNLDRYGLTQAPFGGRGAAVFAPVPSRVAPLNALLQSLQEGLGIAVLTAAAGLGRTALCRELEQRLQPDWLVVLLRDAGYTTRRSLLQAILYELGLPYTGLTEQEARLRLLESIRDRRSQAQGLVLLIDDAQRLNDRLLEELRSLINHEEQGRPLVRLLLCGDPVLEERLIDPALAAVNQRIVCHETLAPLSHEESAQLIDHRLVAAGGDGWEHVFTRAALELLCLVADGSPRNLEQLAKRGLQIAAERREPRISVESIRSALEELKELPLQWNEPANLAAYVAAEQHAANEPESAEALEFADDELGFLDETDAVAVRVGDELPTADWDRPPAFAIEVGGESSAPLYVPGSPDTSAHAALDPLFTTGSTAEHVLFDEHPTTLDDTAIQRHPGLSTSRRWLPHRDARGDIRPVAPAQVTDRAASGRTEVRIETQPEWSETEVKDSYAALDAVTGPVMFQPPLSAPARAVAVPTVTVPAQPSASTTAPAADVRIEDDLLATVRDMAAEVAWEVQSPTAPATPASNTAAPTLESSPWCSGFSTMPEWDVVQPEWLAETSFTPFDISDLHRLELEHPASEPGPKPLAVVETHAEPASTAPAAPAPSPAATPPSPAATTQVVDDPPALASQLLQLRTDEAGHRPYSQLFSRLRRLRSAFRERPGHVE